MAASNRIINRLAALLVGAALVLGAFCAAAKAQEGADAGREERIMRLQETVDALAQEVQAIKRQEEEARLSPAAPSTAPRVEGVPEWTDSFTLGGYGEMHVNLGEGDVPRVFDIHRLVLYVGYTFADWIKFHSELEIEHAYVSKDSGGYIMLEQAYVDFLLSRQLSLRFGRILTPIGIINQRHEPPLFNGVERPSVDRVIIPTTWSSDGIGVFGTLSRALSYELYVVGGLDGSRFSAAGGARDGRIKERSSLNDLAVTGRVDMYPLAGLEMPHDQKLRLGLSAYYGGIDNGNKGADPGIDGSFTMYSADFEYSISKFDFRGVIAHGEISGARQMAGGVASEILGWYLEGGYHFWPEAWKANRLRDADAVVFVRYDDYDTQYRMPRGVPRNPLHDCQEWTLGVNFYPVGNFVVKADYQFRRSAAGNLDNLYNLGVGWTF